MTEQLYGKTKLLNKGASQQRIQTGTQEAVSLAIKLAAWAVEGNISHDALNKLLVILRKHINKDLPKDAEALFKMAKDKGSTV